MSSAAFQNPNTHHFLTNSHFSIQESILAVDVESILSESELFDLKETAQFDFPNFPETDKKFRIAYFGFHSSFEKLSSLFNGLISMGHHHGIVLEYQKDLRRYAFKFYLSREKEAALVLTKLIQVLKGEIKFKTILAKILEDHKNFQQEQIFLKRELFA